MRNSSTLTGSAVSWLDKRVRGQIKRRFNEFISNDSLSYRALDPASYHLILKLRVGKNIYTGFLAGNSCIANARIPNGVIDTSIQHGIWQCSQYRAGAGLCYHQGSAGICRNRDKRRITFKRLVRCHFCPSLYGKINGSCIGANIYKQIIKKYLTG